MKIKVVVVGSNAEGSIELIPFEIECTQESQDNGVHCDMAIDKARDLGYDGHMLAFDEFDRAASQMQDIGDFFKAKNG